MKRIPKIVIVIEGSRITQVLADRAIEVAVIDYDVEPKDFTDNVFIEQDSADFIEARACIRTDVERNSQAVAKRFAEITEPITRGMLEDVAIALGNPDIEIALLRNAIAKYKRFTTKQLRKQLANAEAEFSKQGGRGVSLADAIDERRMALAIREATNKSGVPAT